MAASHYQSLQIVVLLLRPWQTRTPCCGYIDADTNVSPFACARNICCTQILCPGHKKMFLILLKNILCPQQKFPILRSPRTSWATMCPQQCVLVYQGLYKHVFPVVCRFHAHCCCKSCSGYNRTGGFDSIRESLQLLFENGKFCKLLEGKVEIFSQLRRCGDLFIL